MKKFLSILTNTKLKRIVVQLFVYSLIGSIVYILLISEFNLKGMGIGIFIYCSIVFLAIILVLFLLVFLLIYSFAKTDSILKKIWIIISLVVSGVVSFASFHGVILYIDYFDDSVFSWILLGWFALIEFLILIPILNPIVSIKQVLSNLINTRFKRLIFQLFVYCLIGSIVCMSLCYAFNTGSLGLLYCDIKSTSAAVSASFLLMFLSIYSFAKTDSILTEIGVVISSAVSVLVGLFSVYVMGRYISHPFLDINVFLSSHLWNILYGYLPFVFILGSAFLWLMTPKTRLVLILRRLIFGFVYLYLVLNISRLSYYASKAGHGDTPDVDMVGLIPLWGWFALTGLLILVPVLNSLFNIRSNSNTFNEYHNN